MPPNENRPERVCCDCEGDIKEIRRSIASIDHHITGGKTPEKGIIVRLDRIEQTEKRRSRFIGLAISTAVTSAVASIWSLFTGHGSSSSHP